MNKEFNGVITLRLAICYAALNKRPEWNEFCMGLLQAGPAMLEARPINREGTLRDQDWQLYTYYSNESCPLRRIMMTPWLVEGVGALVEDRDYAFEAIDPQACIGNLRDVVNKAVILGLMPDDFMQMVDDLEAAAVKSQTNHPEIIEGMRKALRIKGMAIEDHIARGSHEPVEHYERQILA